MAGGPRRGGRRRKKVCYFTATGTSAKYQRMLTTAIKRARHMALLPYVKDEN